MKTSEAAARDWLCVKGLQNKISMGELGMSVIDNDVKEPMNSSGRKRECVYCICPRRKNDVSART